ncbi:MAG TPA: hypothetical protein VE863_14005 [Pyrinomonadaceae bacterium]|nr:hypothetical protein [Pyrinomonadaceae bacterium]
MSIRQKIGEALLWMGLLFIGTIIGAEVYQRISLIPEWGGALPDSVITYFRGTHAAASIGRFWLSVLPATALVVVAATAFNWPERARRRWLGVGALLFVAMLVWTEVYFVPKGVIPLMAHAGEGLSSDEITRLAKSWIFWDWFRMAGTVGAYLAWLRVLTIRPSLRALEHAKMAA